MKKRNSKEKIVILGAGLAGLAAGYELARVKKTVILVEKWSEVGGLARTIKYKNFLFDTGPHRWYAKSNMVNKWMLDLMGKEIIQVPRLTRIYFDKRFFYYPIRLTNALFGIGFIKAVMAIVDYVRARLYVRLVKPRFSTMEDGYISQFGVTLYKTFFKRYSEKLWGTDCKNISIDWVGQRTRGLNIMTIVKDSLFKSKNVVSLIDEFSYPEKGVGRIAQKLSEEIVKNNGEINTNYEVTQIYHQNNKIISIKAKDRNGKEKIYKGDYFISSIPLNILISSLKPKVHNSILKKVRKLKYRDELQVALFVKKTHITPDTWIYVHSKEIPYMRVMEMDNWSSKLSPKGTTTLVFEIACNEGDEMWNKSDKEIIDIVISSYIDEFQLITKDDVIDGYVHRVPKEYPVYHVGYKEDIKEIKDYVKRYKNIQLIGRNGTFRYNNMDHSIEMGLYAAWNIMYANKHFDIDAVNIEREYLEEKKIETVEDDLLEKTDDLK